MTLREKVKAFEREQIVIALRSELQNFGRMNRVSKALGVHRKTLRQKINEYKIQREEWHPQQTMPFFSVPIPIDQVAA